MNSFHDHIDAVREASALLGHTGYLQPLFADVMLAVEGGTEAVNGWSGTPEALACAAFDYAASQLSGRLWQQCGGGRESLSRLHRMVECLACGQPEAPASSAATVLFQALADPATFKPVRDAALRCLRECERCLAQGVRDAADAGFLPFALQEEDVARHIISVLEGAYRLAFVYADMSYVQRAHTHLTNYLQHQLVASL